MTPRILYLGIPHYGSIEPNGVPSLLKATKADFLRLRLNGASLLAFNFNLLWCEGLNGRAPHDPGFTHFAMMHADVQAADWWIDTLIGELERTGADVMTTVIPLKDPRGLTSTGTMSPHPSYQFPVVDRLTMKQVCELPVTFGAEDIKPGSWLAPNTGLWVADIRKPWVEEFPGFNVKDQIVRDPDTGLFVPGCVSEDWNFGGWCARNKVKVMATRAVSVNHHGRASWDNQQPWGEWEKDKGDKAYKLGA